MKKRKFFIRTYSAKRDGGGGRKKLYTAQLPSFTHLCYHCFRKEKRASLNHRFSATKYGKFDFSMILVAQKLKSWQL